MRAHVHARTCEHNPALAGRCALLMNEIPGSQSLAVLPSALSSHDPINSLAGHDHICRLEQHGRENNGDIVGVGEMLSITD